MQEMEDFIKSWSDTSGIKNIFLSLKDFMEAQKDTVFVFNARPGVTYSLRATLPTQKDRPLYAMMDVIDDDPQDRWLSVCFFGEMITDPDEMGDLIPDGLVGEDGYCFDITDTDQTMVNCVKARLKEAYQSAAG